ncbi:MAG TPA: DUF192 domain-containing protein [Rhizomicrobium sp.]|jgi:hypothetical protein|nr:DUF192 domain-containing protein [Rhizomicrobium sp.]
MRMTIRVPILAFAVLIFSAADAAAAHGLPVETVVVATHGGPRSFTMEVAADDASRATGLMHRTHLAKDAGMLFDFGKPVMTAFWMKDTPLPLDMLFVRADGTISTVAANAVPFSTAEISSAEPIRAVIEINGGLARTLGIAPGDRVRAPIFPHR